MSFAPLGVDFGSMGVDYRILQMICLENLIREFTDEKPVYKQRDLGQFLVSFV